MSSFSCPHLDLERDWCLRIKTDCVPGLPGCVLPKNTGFIYSLDERRGRNIASPPHPSEKTTPSMANRADRLGYGLVAVSALAFALKAVLIKLIYREGLDPLTVLSFRMILALPFFWLCLFLSNEGFRVNRRDILPVALAGLVGFYASAVSGFYGLAYIEAVLERIVLFIYPAIVAILSSVFFKEKITPAKLISLGLTYLGVLLCVDPFGIEPARSRMIGVILVLASASTYACYFILVQRLKDRMSTIKLTTYSLTIGTVAILGTWIGTWQGSRIPAGGREWGLLFMLSAGSTFVPFVTLVAGIKRIGASRAAMVGTISPISTAILGAVVLGELPGFMQVAGIVTVIGGVLILGKEGLKSHAL